MGVLHALDQTGNLNVEHSAAVLGQFLTRLREVGMHEVFAGQAGFGELAAPGEGEIVALFIKAAAFAPQAHHVLHIDFGNGQAVFLLGGGKDAAVFRNQAEPGKHMVGCALALAGRGEHHAAAELF